MKSVALSVFVCMIGLILTIPGCDKPKQKANRPAAAGPTYATRGEFVAEGLVGLWECKMGGDKPGSPLISTMTLDLRKDKRFTLTNVMPDDADSSKSITNISEGHWLVNDAGEQVVLSLERSIKGPPIPADQRQVKLWAATDRDGEILGFNIGQGPGFRRKSR